MTLTRSTTCVKRHANKRLRKKTEKHILRFHLLINTQHSVCYEWGQEQQVTLTKKGARIHNKNEANLRKCRKDKLLARTTIKSVFKKKLQEKIKSVECLLSPGLVSFVFQSPV